MPALVGLREGGVGQTSPLSIHDRHLVGLVLAALRAWDPVLGLVVRAAARR